MQAQTKQAQPPLPLPALKQLVDELAERMAQHLKAGNLVAALQGLGSFDAAVLGACVPFHPMRGLGVAIAVLGAIITTSSGLSRVCNFTGRATQNDCMICLRSITPSSFPISFRLGHASLGRH